MRTHTYWILWIRVGQQRFVQLIGMRTRSARRAAALVTGTHRVFGAAAIATRRGGPRQQNRGRVWRWIVR